MSYDSFLPWDYETQANLNAKTSNPDGTFNYTEEGILQYKIVRLRLAIRYYKDFCKFHP